MHSTRLFASFATAMLLTVGVVAYSNAQAPATPTPTTPTPTTPAPNARVTTTAPGSASTTAASQNWKASDLIGQAVHTTDDQEKGKIKDLMIGPDGKIVYAAVSFGGFIGIGDKLFAVPMDAIRITWKDGKLDKARVAVTEQNIKQREGFNEDRWPQQADRGFMAGQAGTTTTVK